MPKKVCWKGYKRVPGTKKYSEGSCEKKTVSEEFISEVDSEGQKKKKIKKEKILINPVMRNLVQKNYF